MFGGCLVACRGGLAELEVVFVVADEIGCVGEWVFDGGRAAV